MVEPVALELLQRGTWQAASAGSRRVSASSRRRSRRQTPSKTPSMAHAAWPSLAPRARRPIGSSRCCRPSPPPSRRAGAGARRAHSVESPVDRARHCGELRRCGRAPRRQEDLLRARSSAEESWLTTSRPRDGLDVAPPRITLPRMLPSMPESTSPRLQRRDGRRGRLLGAARPARARLRRRLRRGR